MAQGCQLANVMECMRRMGDTPVCVFKHSQIPGIPVKASGHVIPALQDKQATELREGVGRDMPQLHEKGRARCTNRKMPQCRWS